MSEFLYMYRYSPLSLGSHIRLLRLLPHEDQNAPVQCQLFDYSLQESGKRTHPYDALSYVWGSSDKPRFISISQHGLQYNLPVTENIHETLSRLRYHAIERIIWIDAICINQENEKEKEQQIQFMAKIYAQANRVVVWLGEAADDSDRALEEIRVAGDEESTNSSNKTIQQAVIALLDRPWFRRIWVLQEVAAARHIVIICGFTEIDGHAFCSGLTSLKLSYEAYPKLQNLIPSVIYLIRGAIFRPKYATSSGRISLNIRPLGELIDMYHARDATDRRDKVFALLGMSSDDNISPGLLPNYGIQWEQLFERLIKFILCEEVCVHTWYDREIAVIKSKGCILGQVSSVRSDNRQNVNIKSKNTAWYSGDKEWTLQASAKSIREGDIICLLRGASKPTIIRLYKDYFIIIVIAATPLNKREILERPEHSESIIHFPRDLLLVWDWEEHLGESQDRKEYEILVKRSNRVLEYSKAEFRDQLDKATRVWNVVVILEDLGEYENAEESLREAIKGYQMAFREEYPYPLKSHSGRTPLSWAAGNGYTIVVNYLLKKDYIFPDLEDSQSGRTPLSWAAGGGGEAVVKLLLETGKIDVDSKDMDSRTPLSWAAGEGHEAVVKLLLKTGKVNVDSKDKDSRTPLSWAAERGHEAVVKLLLETGKVDVDSKDSVYSRTSLSWAARRGYKAVVKLLLETGKVDVGSKDKDSRTPLSCAASGGHEALVKLLLETGKVAVDSKDKRNRTPLSCAAGRGHKAVVKLLLATGKVDVDSKDSIYGRTPLSWAVSGGYEAVVKLLLETCKVDVDSKDSMFSQTPLSWAASGGHEAVVKLLLKTGKVDVNSKDKDSQTPLSQAASRGYEAVVKLLLETGKADVDSKGKLDGWTPLSWAARQGHEAVVKLLLETGKVKVELRDKDNRTLLSWAAGEGREAVVKLLLDTGKVDADSKDMGNRTPLSWAAGGGYDAVVKLLLETGKVDADSKDTESRTPLSWAAGGGHGAVVKLLLKTGKVAVDSKDKLHGWAPVSWAASREHEAVVKLLRSSTTK